MFRGTSDDPTSSEPPATFDDVMEAVSGNGDSQSQADGTEPKKFDATKFDPKKMGYTGESCSKCQSTQVVRNGACTMCLNCGTTTGCS